MDYRDLYNNVIAIMIENNMFDDNCCIKKIELFKFCRTFVEIMVWNHARNCRIIVNDNEIIIGALNMDLTVGDENFRRFYQVAEILDFISSISFKANDKDNYSYGADLYVTIKVKK